MRCPPSPACTGCVLCLDPVASGRVLSRKRLDKISKRINDPHFKDLEELSDNRFEVMAGKHKIIMDTPIQIGCAVYQLAKLRMLQFYYDCLDKYVDRSDFQYIEMDTDSAYPVLLLC